MNNRKDDKQNEITNKIKDQLEHAKKQKLIHDIDRKPSKQKIVPSCATINISVGAITINNYNNPAYRKVRRQSR